MKFTGRVKSLKIKCAKFLCSFASEYSFTIDNANNEKKNVCVAYDEATNTYLPLPEEFTCCKAIFDFISAHSTEKLNVTYAELKSENSKEKKYHITAAEIIYG